MPPQNLTHDIAKASRFRMRRDADEVLYDLLAKADPDFNYIAHFETSDRSWIVRFEQDDAPIYLVA